MDALDSETYGMQAAIRTAWLERMAEQARQRREAREVEALGFGPVGADPDDDIIDGLRSGTSEFWFPDEESDEPEADDV